MSNISLQPCQTYTFLEDRERRLRAAAVGREPLIAAAYTLSAGELRMVRFDHVSAGCAPCIAFEAAENALNATPTPRSEQVAGLSEMAVR